MCLSIVPGTKYWLYILVLTSVLNTEICFVDIVKTTKGFDAKLKCDGRTYSYLCPTYTFMPLEEVKRRH